MNQKQKVRIIGKWILYALLLMLCYAVQTTQGLTIPFFGARPILIVSIMISVSFLEAELPAAVFAFFCGLLMDYAVGTVLGYFAFFFVITAVVVSFVTHSMALMNLYSFAITSGIALLSVSHLDFLIRYLLKEEVGSAGYYWRNFLPMVFYTLVLTWAIFWVVKKIFVWLTPAGENEMVE